MKIGEMSVEESFELKKKIKNPMIMGICLNLIFVLFLSLGNLLYYLEVGNLSSYLFISSNILFILLFILFGHISLRKKHFKWAILSWMISLIPIASYFAVAILWAKP